MPLRLPWIWRGGSARSRRPLRPSSLNVEVLEDRCLLSTYVVNTTKDVLGDTTGSELTLRDAITAIDTQAQSGNAKPGTASNTIDFAINAAGSDQTIDVGSGNVAAALPALTHPVFFDGWSQGGTKYSGPPLIVLNGLSAGSGANGLTFAAGSGGSEVRGLVLQQFNGNGIEVQGTKGNLITANYIGTTANGVAGAGNGNDGVLLDAGATNNTIGGTAASAGNVISANGDSATSTGNGIEITGAGTSGNLVQGNFIGTDKTATLALGNVLDGVLVDGGATGNTIGGTVGGAANIVCGSVVGPPSGIAGTQAAVFSLSPASIAGNIASFDVTLNYTDAAPDQMVYVGVDIRQSSSALVTNPSTGQPDYSAFNFVPSSTIGVGWGPVGNAFPGEFLFHTPPATAGLAPNADYFVGTITYNLAQFNVSPSSSLFVSIRGGYPTTVTSDTTIGAEIPGKPATFNFVNPTFTIAQQPLVNAAVPTAGVEINGAGTSGNQVLGNRIGVNRTGTEIGQLTDGVHIDAGAAQNTVGGTVTGTGNVIVGNTLGVLVGNSPADTATVDNTILGNSMYANIVATIELANQATTTTSVNPRSYPNDGQNAPLITTLTQKSIVGSLTGVPNTSYRLEFFANPVVGTPGQKFLGFLKVPTNAAGSLAFNFPIPTLPLGDVVTATATNLANGDTSGSSPIGTQIIILANPTITSSGSPQVAPVTIQVLTANGPATSGQLTITIPGIPGAVTIPLTGKGTITVDFPVPAGTLAGQYALIASVDEDEALLGAAEGLLTINAAAVARRWSR